MKKVLIIDEHKAEELADVVRSLKPLWHVVDASSFSETLEMLQNFNLRLDLVVISFGVQPGSFDPLALLLQLRLNPQLRFTRFMVLLPPRWDKQDNRAAQAAGADWTEIYPTTFKHMLFVLKAMLKVLYAHDGDNVLMPLTLNYKANISQFPVMN